MKTLLFPLILLPLAGIQDLAADRARLERFRRLTTQQKEQLRERVEQLRGASPEERRRLADNLRRFREMSESDRRHVRERLEKLSPEERRATADLAAGFFRFAHQQGYADKFPRDVFFSWLRTSHRPELERLRAMSPEDRRKAFVRLSSEFQDDRMGLLLQHARRHGCASPDEVRRLRDLPNRDFWPRLHDRWKRCREPHAPHRPR